MNTNVESQGGSPFGTRAGGWVRALRIVAGIVVLALAGGGAAYYGRAQGSGDPAATHQHGAIAGADSAAPVSINADLAKRIGVTYAVATTRPLDREVRTVGQVTFDETRVQAISPKVDGWIERLYVNFTGQFVRRGDSLFSIYAPELVAAQQELLLARRLTTEVADGPQDVVRGAQDLLASARRRLQYWDVPDADIARIEQSGVVEKTLTLRAPADGFVVDKNVLPGQRIMAGESVYRVADLGTVWIDGEVFEQDHTLVRLGARVAVELQAFPGERFTGVIAYMYPTLSAETRTMRVRVELGNPGYRLKPGMYATILVSSGGAPVLSVPRSALLETGTRTLVFVRRSDGMLFPREVVRGAADDQHVEILHGLVAGDTVVASATFLVDAESNLKSALGAMGAMPGMDMGPPPAAQDHSAHRE